MIGVVPHSLLCYAVTMFDPKPFVAYSVRVRNGSYSWTLAKRYSQFVDLHNKVGPALTQLQHPSHALLVVCPDIYCTCPVMRFLSPAQSQNPASGRGAAEEAVPGQSIPRLHQDAAEGAAEVPGPTHVEQDGGAE